MVQALEGPLHLPWLCGFMADGHGGVRVKGKDSRETGPTTLPGAALNDVRPTPPGCEIRGWQGG